MILLPIYLLLFVFVLIAMPIADAFARTSEDY